MKDRTIIEGMRNGKTLFEALMYYQRDEEVKKPPCKRCRLSERFDGVLFCRVSGKIVLPMFEDVCCCHGKRLEN